jgi:hypothetical protein
MDTVNASHFHLFKNPRASRGTPYEAERRADILSNQAFEVAKRKISCRRGLGRAGHWRRQFLGAVATVIGTGHIVLLFGTEGATDQKVYQQIVGRSADQGRARIAA